MTANTTAGRGRRADDAPADKGCYLWQCCASCPFVRCAEELPADERARLTHAWRTVLAHVALPDRTIPA